MNQVNTQHYFANQGWWKILFLIPLLFLLWLFISLTNTFIAFHLSVRLSGYLTTLEGWIILANIAVSFYSPFVIYHDRKALAEQTGWTPNILYVISFIPLVNVLVVSVYLVQRRRAIKRVSP